MYTWLSLSSVADLAQLAKHITSEYEPARVISKITNGLSEAVRAVLIEKSYIDKDYRSTYYNFYAKKGQTYRLDCVRLHFFDATVTFDDVRLRVSCPDGKLDHHYFGYMVLRPTGIATIGRSVLSPDVRNGAHGPVITATYKVHLLGYRLTVDGFPSMDQHIDISVCAHVACWSVLRHYSERYSNYREFLTHDITMMAQPFNPGGLLPSKGLDVSHAERVFQAAGTFPMIVTRKNSRDAVFDRQLLAYIESGFPLFSAMHKWGHAVTLVGYDWRSPTKRRKSRKLRYAWDQVKRLNVVDDNSLPYLSIPMRGVARYSARHIDAFIVALPEKVFYPAEAVDRIAPILFKFHALLNMPPKNDTIIRYFMATGSGLRNFMRDRESEFDPRLLRTVLSLPFAQFVWIIELATESDWAAGQISARAVVDATASLRDRFPFWLVHTRTKALIFDRGKVGAGAAAVRALALSGMQNTALTRWNRNLRPTQSKNKAGTAN